MLKTLLKLFKLILLHPQTCKMFKIRKKFATPPRVFANNLKKMKRDRLVSDECLLFIILNVFIVNMSTAAVLKETTTDVTADMLTTIPSVNMTVSSNTTAPMKTSNFKESLKPHQRAMLSVEFAGEPRALHIEPVLSQQDMLQLNVTWKPPKGRRLPDYYTMVVIPLNDTITCRSKLCYVPSINGSAYWFLVPEILTSAAGAECEINPGCSYAVNLKAHPWNGKINVTKEINLPDCVEDKCNCDHQLFIEPSIITAELINSSFINVTWTYANTSLIEHELSNYVLHIYDRVMTLPIKPLKVEAVAHRPGEDVVSRLVNITNILSKGKSYVIRVMGIDVRQCRWPEGKFTIHIPDDAVTDEPRHMLIINILIVLMAFFFLACLTISLSRCRVCYWLKRILAPKVVGTRASSNGHIRKQEAWPGERNQ